MSEVITFDTSPCPLISLSPQHIPSYNIYSFVNSNYERKLRREKDIRTKVKNTQLKGYKQSRCILLIFLVIYILKRNPMDRIHKKKHLHPDFGSPCFPRKSFINIIWYTVIQYTNIGSIKIFFTEDKSCTKRGR